MKNMTSRERVEITLRHEEPDKIPIDFGGVHTSLHKYAHSKLIKFLKLNGPDAKIQEVTQQIVYPDKRVLDLFQTDIIGVYAKAPSFWKLKIDPINKEFKDEWGTVWFKPKDGYFYDLKKPAMENFTIRDLKEYEFPDPWDKGRIKGLRDEILDLYQNTDKAIIMFSSAVGIWENLWFLRGFEQAYIDLVANVEFIELFFAKFLW